MVPGAETLLLLAALVQGLILFAVAALLYRERIPRVTRGEIHPRDIALNKENWPDAAKKVSNAFDNQFQVPVLFYVAVGIELYLEPLWIGVLLAWLFVLTRIVHAAIHVTSNHVIRRFFAFATGTVMLFVWWLVLIVRVVLGGF